MITIEIDNESYEIPTFTRNKERATKFLLDYLEKELWFEH